MNMIAEATIILAAAILVVPIFRKLGLGDVLGYLTAGVLIGPSVFGFVGNATDILHFAEIGVVFLLFVIGLELQPARLWVFRKLMFGLGTLQLLITMAVFAAIGRVAGLEWPAATAIGGALALSSTAFVLQLMSEKKELIMPHGRAAFGVLLLQDVAVIPLLALIGVLGADTEFAFGIEQALQLGTLLLLLVAAIVAGRFLLRVMVRSMVSVGNQQILLATALFVVMGSGVLFERIGLSMGLGAFTAGVLMSDSEFRHQLEADVLPFKGLLLGLFFIAVGMLANLSVLIEQPLAVAFIVACLVLGKALILFPLGYLFGLRESGPLRFSILLAQGGEFAFVLLTPALSTGLVGQGIYDVVVLSVTVSMIFTPLLVMLEERWREGQSGDADDRPFDDIDEQLPRVFIAGFGRVGQIIGRVLNSRGIPFVAIDANAKHVDFVRRYGNEVYYGDATRFDVLRAAGVGQADVFVCAISDPEVSLTVAEHVRSEYPHVKVYCRARNRQHALALRSIGVAHAIRDTLYSSLKLSESVLVGSGYGRDEARDTVEVFRQHDLEMLDKQYEVRDDEDAVMQQAREAAEQLKYLFEQDQGRK